MTNIHPHTVVDGSDHPNASTSVRECAAMRLLAADGWSIGELKMTFFACTNDTVRRHVTGKCGHSVPVLPLEDWRQEIDPQERIRRYQKSRND